MRPPELARKLNVSPKHLRHWLREEYPRPASMKQKPWVLTEAQVAAARERFAVPWKRAASREHMTVTTLALPDRVYERLTDEAASQHMAMVELVRMIVAEWLARHRRRVKSGRV
jgi:hypothetical protein